MGIRLSPNNDKIKNCVNFFYGYTHYFYITYNSEILLLLS